jgi:hypothetical protein
MRTTVTIDDALYRRAKARAALAGQSVGSVMEEALRVLLRDQSAPGEAPSNLPSFDCGPFLPGIDPNDTSSLLDPLLLPEPASDAGR